VKHKIQTVIKNRTTKEYPNPHLFLFLFIYLFIVVVNLSIDSWI